MTSRPPRDGDAYPSVSSISRQDLATPSAPVISPGTAQGSPHVRATVSMRPCAAHKLTEKLSLGVEWRETLEVHDSECDPPAGPQVSRSRPTARLSLQSELTILRWAGLATCAVQIGAAIALPLASYILVVKQYDRFAIEDYVHWGISLFAGSWGMMALGCMRATALAVHVVLGATVAAALAAHNSSLFADIELRCSIAQAAFINCGFCPCAALNACSWEDLSQDGICFDCGAPAAGFCHGFWTEHTKLILAFTGPATLFLMATPVIFSLLALLKVQCAFGLETSNRVAHGLATVNQQLVHLNARENLTTPLNSLLDALRIIEAEGSPAALQLADQCRTALNRAGYNVPPRGYEDRRKEHDNTSIAVVASPPSAAPSHRSIHSLSSARERQQPPLSATQSPLLYSQPDSWRSPSATMPRPPQPAAMTFPTAGGQESIYYK